MPRLQSRNLLALCPLIIHLLKFWLITQARAVEISVDDSDGSIEYSPADSWQQGNGCGTCTLSPDVGRTHDGTWHDTTFFPGGSNRTISFRFTGTAISAYFIVPDRPQGSASVETSLIFSLDGVEVDSYAHFPTDSVDFLYNQSAFLRENLTNSGHTLEVNAAPGTDGASTSVLFDYLVYTAEDETPTETPSTASSLSPTQSSSIGTSPTSSRSNTGAIAGGVVGGVLGTLLLITLLICLRKSKRSKSTTILPADDELSPTGTAARQAGGLLKWFSFPKGKSSSLLAQPAVFVDHNDVTRGSQVGDVNGATNEKSRTHAQKQQKIGHVTPIHGTSASHTVDRQPRNRSETEDPSTAAILSHVAQLQATVISLQEQRLHENRYGDGGAGGFVDPNSESAGHNTAPPEYSRVA